MEIHLNINDDIKEIILESSSNFHDMASSIFSSNFSEKSGVKVFGGFINGQFVRSLNGRFFDINNPATGEVIGQVPCMEAADTELAISAAVAAQPSWASRTARERSIVLREWHRLMMQHQEELATIMTVECGKPLAEAKGEVAYAASFVEWFSEEAKRSYGQVIPSPNKSARFVTFKQPVGVCGLITPWNFPAAMIARKVAPALAAGCSTVIKPSEETPFTALALAELAKAAGVPDGIINVVTADRGPLGAAAVGAVLCSHPQVRKISFTGSTQVGKLLMAQAASTVKRVSLELGGNAPFMVFGDADLDVAVNAAMSCKFRNAGQTCVSANRFIVHESVATAFEEKLQQAMESRLKVGNGLDKGITMGPLINAAAVKKVERHIQDAKAKGARILCGGSTSAFAQGTGGHFYEPTLVNNVQSNMLLWQEEIFGPVIAIRTFSTDEEGLELANDTDKGLASYFCTRDLSRAWHVGEKLRSGMVGLNEGIISSEVAPFGGIKESGLGREGAQVGLDEYVELKYLCMGGI